MTRQRLLPALAVLGAVLTESIAGGVQSPPVVEDVGLSGYVLSPDGTPVSSGSVVLLSRAGRTSTTTPIDRNGRFRVMANTPGLHQLAVSVTGLAPFRLSLTVPPSRTLKLPVIRLSPPTYFRARLVTTDGVPIASPRLRRQSLDVNAVAISSAFNDQFDNDGTITIGPLPRGVTTLAVDVPLLAQTRLPDLHVTGEQQLLDAGTVTVQPGATLHVDVVDATGAPVAGHNVSLEDVSPFSPLSFRPERTNQQGRVTFTRLSEGRYRVRTRVVGLCGNQWLSIARVVAIAGNGTLGTRLVVSGQATLRVSSPLGPMRAVLASASPDSGQSPPPAWVRGRSDANPLVGRPVGSLVLPSACEARTDADGRLTLPNFPPGSARVEIRLPNSTYVTRVGVPEDGREVPIAVPEGYLPVRVSDVVQKRRVAGATITWSGGGTRVEATSSANGEALLEAVGATPGTLTITARDYQPSEVKYSEPPGLLQEIALTPEPASIVQLRVVASSGEPVRNAIVELLPGNPMEDSQLAVTDAKGVVQFSDAPPGPLRFVASAEGFVPALMQVSDDKRVGSVLTLARGHRIVASVELPADAGPHLVRVFNAAGVSMEPGLDSGSDRRVDPPGRLSLGPLPPGSYVVELQGPGEPRQERVRVVDRDVDITFR